MATWKQVERFFKDTNVILDDWKQGKDGFIHLLNGELELTISASVGANSIGDTNQPKLVIDFGKRL